MFVFSKKIISEIWEEAKRRVRRVSPINVGGGLSLVLTVPSASLTLLEKVCEIIILDGRLQKSKSVNIQN
jgi:hypothetical protein